MFKSKTLFRLTAASVLGVGSYGIYHKLQTDKHRLRLESQVNSRPSNVDKKTHDLQKDIHDNITLWTGPSREDMIESMHQKDVEYDLLIIGGGATGCGVAVDAASRGLKVALVERDDFASGTSSKSTKLVHGGVRYLEKAVWNLDWEQYKLVQEALSERFTVLKIAPYLTSQLPIMCPIYKWYLLPYYWAGTKAYDLVAGSRGLESSYLLTKTKALKEFPMLKSDGLVGAVVYYDGQQNDSRMNVALALTAAYHGAHLANHVEVTKLTKSADGKVSGAMVKDEFTGKEWAIRAKGVVNATGPYVDAIRQMDDPQCTKIIAASSGTHIVLPHYFSPEHMGLIDPATSDGRVIFFLPWESNTVAGTTDAPTEITYDPKPKEEEIEFILSEVSHYLDPSILVRRGDVLSAWTGIRPLVKNPNATNTQSLVRSHLILSSPSGLLTVAGGKWTTYRKMAEEAVDMAIDMYKLKPQHPCQTEDLLLIGSHHYNPLSYIRLIQHFGMETEVSQHLIHNYGDRAFAVASMSSKTEQRWPLYGKRLSYPYLFIEAEVRYAVRREYARTAVDVLARRTRLAFLNAAAAKHCLSRVVDIMAEELNWSDQRKQQEIKKAKQFLETMGLKIVSSRNIYKPEELEKFRVAFTDADKDKDGIITTSDLIKLFQRIGAAVSIPSLNDIMRDIDVNKNGLVDFDEFLDVMQRVDEVRHETHLGSRLDEVYDLAVKHDVPERSNGGV
ncbi:hypothetical protein MP228_001888 [Amoeboaphelidium protococcarum]|nr:hypothetical protein MP228_001888 [Amoeboaphelidium protococcarum]